MEQVLAKIPEWHDVDLALFEREIITQYRPAVLRGVVGQWPIVEQARISPLAAGKYLHSLDNGTPVQAIMIPPGVDRRVFYQADLRGVNFIRNKLPISAIIEQVLRYSAFPNPPSVAVQSALISECLPGFLDAHPLPFLAARPAPRIWLGNRLTVPAHIDEGNNIACVVSGKRRFTLFPPEQIANLYVGPLEFTPNAAPVSMVDSANPDFDRFPRYREALAAAQMAELEAGDALFIPALWWHQVESLSDMNILINYWWGGSFGAAQSPVDCLLHCLVAMKQLPPEHRAAWSHYFQHFIFAADPAAAAHIPADRRGVLGELTPEQARAIKARLIARLQKESSNV